MILEFTGLSGAGKSTSEPHIISGLKQRGLEVIVRTEFKKSNYKKIICPNFEAKDGFLFNQLSRQARWKTLRSVGLSGPFMLSVFSKVQRNLFFWLGDDIILSKYYSKEHETLPASNSVYISQEGFVHHCACLRLWHGGAFSSLPKRIVQKFSPEKIIIIYFEISVEEALDRLLKRTRGIPDDWPRKINTTAKVKKVLSRFNEIIEDVVGSFQAEGVQVLSVDSSLELKQVRTRVESIVDKLSQNGNNDCLEKKLFN